MKEKSDFLEYYEVYATFFVKKRTLQTLYKQNIITKCQGKSKRANVK